MPIINPPPDRLGLLSLDVDAPDKVASVLRKAAEAYRRSADELNATWQSRAPGIPWRKIARILDKAADQCERAIKNP